MCFNKTKICAQIRNPGVILERFGWVRNVEGSGMVSFKDYTPTRPLPAPHQTVLEVDEDVDEAEIKKAYRRTE